MRNKLILWAFIILLAALGVFVFMYFHTNTKLENAEAKYNLEKIEALDKLTEEKNAEIEQKDQKHLEEMAELSNQEQSIKYIPYEKLLYTDRDVDSAFRVIAGYKFNTRADKKAQ